jgi:hypothetical protein
MALPNYLLQFPGVAQLTQNANHVDVKSIISRKPFRHFVTEFLDYQPGWVTFLYGVRLVFVRFLGMKQAGLPRPPQHTPDQLPMMPGQKAAIFKVRAAVDDMYWAGEADDSHLRATLVIVREPLGTVENRYYVMTIVHYHNWAGPVYFNVIRPFHHLVVGSMMRAGAG